MVESQGISLLSKLEFLYGYIGKLKPEEFLNPTVQHGTSRYLPELVETDGSDESDEEY